LGILVSKNGYTDGYGCCYLTTRSYGYMCLKMFFFQNLVLVLEMAILECFGENIVKELKRLIDKSRHQSPLLLVSIKRIKLIVLLLLYLLIYFNFILQKS